MSGESKASLSFQYRWENILTPVPVALNALGACAVATGSQKANTSFAPPKEGFKHLSDFAGVKLHTNLSKCVDLGRFASMETEKQMSKINMFSETVYGRLSANTISWNYASLDRLNSSKEIDGKFRDWINHACELHRACVAAEPTSEDQQVLKDIELAVAGASIDYQQQISTNQFQKSLEAANEAFRRASDGLPKGWDIVGRQVVEKLADSLATALNQAMPTPSASKPKDADDPVYSQVVRDLIYWELLSTAFVGTTDGIAWDRTGQAATFAAKMLAHSQKSFGSLASVQSLIANGIMTEVEQSDKSMGYTAPSKDSEAVKSWQRDFLSNYATVITLNATAKSFLGSIANGSTVSSQRGNMDIETVQVHAKTAQAQAVVESAKTRLHAASEALAATRETNQNSTGILFEQQERLNHVNAKMESLKNSAPEMIILERDHGNEDQDRHCDLVRFFNAISVAVRFVTEKYLNAYVDTIKAGNDGDKIGPYSMLDFQRMYLQQHYHHPILLLDLCRLCFNVGPDVANEYFPNAAYGRRTLIFWWHGDGSENDQKAKDGQSKTIRNMGTRVSETNEKKQSLPSVSPEIATAISSGVGNSKRAAQQGIRTEADQSLLVKPLAKGSEF
ncbi:hypothetical protein FOXG_12355 [Fusarium oxysporum f. sp. lycopersici 4287]|uniref:Uncharacterized protein n=2 Tax=Fusarium oxysporum TaxID=5507 RepID=A0A0J9VPJ4_FUSO4|nr:hypothetical protein FOXG_12355 [Fusarium oxysporum f. sp. lycopersici 4287]KAJ9414456.1 hypothetical protein QL093DRAFT_2023968 [Fusarium oxysporum]KNB12873.1 hypothetical protein FOXG_12355 [Fusarium oxysporum f. sp. lycopersici 4287]